MKTTIFSLLIEQKVPGICLYVFTIDVDVVESSAEGFEHKSAEPGGSTLISWAKYTVRAICV